MLTSHIFMRAMEHGVDVLIPCTECTTQGSNDVPYTFYVIRRNAALPLLSVVSDRFARAMPPNFCVQLSEGLLQKELDFFFFPALRNGLTMCFVFRLCLFICSDTIRAQCLSALRCFCSKLRPRLPHITEMHIVFDTANAESDSHRLAVFDALPQTLSKLTVSLPRDACDWADPCCINDRDMAVLGTNCPHLAEFRVLHDMYVSERGLRALFQPPSEETRGLFPSLRRLEATVDGVTQAVIDEVTASNRALLSQLVEFVVAQ